MKTKTYKRDTNSSFVISRGRSHAKLQPVPGEKNYDEVDEWLTRERKHNFSGRPTASSYLTKKMGYVLQNRSCLFADCKRFPIHVNEQLRQRNAVL